MITVEENAEVVKNKVCLGTVGLGSVGLWSVDVIHIESLLIHYSKQGKESLIALFSWYRIRTC